MNDTPESDGEMPLNPSEEQHPRPEAETEVAEQPTVDEALAASSPDEATFHAGGALSGRGALSIAAQRRTSVVVLAGAVRSGKSTILASLYERFGRGPVGGHLFAGSRTVPGFERLCHRGRQKSGADRPGMEHTHHAAFPWLHLCVKRAGYSGPPRDLLLADMSGEHFEDLLAGKKEVRDIPELWRADHICLLLDGRNFARAARRAGERQRALDLCSTFLSSGTDLGTRTVLTVVITKWDLIHRAEDDAEEATMATVEELEHLMHREDVPLALVRTAARSVTHEFPLGHGVDDLLNRWTDRPVVQLDHPAPGVSAASRFDDFSRSLAS